MIHRFEPGDPTRDTEGTIAAISHFAGEGVKDVRKVQPAAEIVKEVSSEAERILNEKPMRVRL